MPRLLKDAPALLQHLGLTADLVGQPVVEVLEAVHVLELGLHAELRLAAAAQAHVSVAAQAPLLHRAVGDADGEVDLAQLLHEQARLLGRAQIGLGDELDERRAGAVVVHERVRGSGDAPFPAAHVHHLTRVLLHVDARDAHVRGVALGRAHDVAKRLALRKRRRVHALARRRAVHRKVEVPAHAERHRPLRGLEVLRHVGVHVVLAVEHAAALDVAVRGEARQHDGLDGRLVRHGQGTRKPQAHGAGVRVRRRAELQLAAAEHLRLERRQLRVDLQADDGLPIPQHLFEHAHATHPPFRPRRPAPAGRPPRRRRPHRAATQVCRAARRRRARSPGPREPGRTPFQAQRPRAACSRP